MADAGKSSYAFINGFIDHMLISPRMDSFYVKQSMGVLDNLGQFISNFSNNTSDHYPIYGRFLLNKIKYVTPVDTIPPDTSHVNIFELNKKNKMLQDLKKGTQQLASYRRNLASIEDKYLNNLYDDGDIQKAGRAAARDMNMAYGNPYNSDFD